MVLNKKAIVTVVLALFLMVITATVEARVDPSTLLAQAMMKGEANYMVKSTTSACCNNCTCTESSRPQCQCNDVGETCHSACNQCFCLLMTFPPSCHCFDVTDFCYDPCPSAGKSH